VFLSAMILISKGEGKWLQDDNLSGTGHSAVNTVVGALTGLTGDLNHWHGWAWPYDNQGGRSRCAGARRS